MDSPWAKWESHGGSEGRGRGSKEKGWAMRPGAQGRDRMPWATLNHREKRNLSDDLWCLQEQGSTKRQPDTPSVALGWSHREAPLRNGASLPRRYPVPLRDSTEEMGALSEGGAASALPAFPSLPARRGRRGMLQDGEEGSELMQPGPRDPCRGQESPQFHQDCPGGFLRPRGPHPSRQ